MNDDVRSRGDRSPRTELIRYFNYRVVPATLLLMVWGFFAAVMNTIGFENTPGWTGVGVGIVLGALLMDALLDGGHVSHV